MSATWKCHGCGQAILGEVCCPCLGPPLFGPGDSGLRPPTAQDDRLQAMIDRSINARLRRIVERLRVPHGGLVPDAEVYVRAALAKAIEEGLEER